MEHFDDVPDPSDFPVDTLRKLDSSLRCPVCKELFDAPVILHCGHTFCSFCIRNLLPTKPECPKCRAPAKELHIVRNATFEEAVTAWSDARAHTLQLARKSVRSFPSPSAKLPKGTKRKLPQQTSDLEPGPSKLTRRESDKSQGAPLEQEDDGGNYSDVDDEGLMPQDSTVQCPVCNRDVALGHINQHMDSGCKKFVADDMNNSIALKTGYSNPKTAWDTIFNGQGKKTTGGYSAEDSEIPVNKIAKVSYGTMKISEIRKLLSDRGLSTAGGERELIQRHQKWIAIYNANLDRGQPKTRYLKQQLKDIEEVASRFGPKKVLDEGEYTRKNSAHFASLIERARPRSKNTGELVSATQPTISPTSGPQTTARTSSSYSIHPSDVIIIE